MKRIYRSIRAGGAVSNDAAIPSDWNNATRFGVPKGKSKYRKPKRTHCKKCKMPFKSDMPSSKGVRLICLDGNYDEKANKANYEFDRKLTICDCEKPEKPNKDFVEFMESQIGKNPTKLQRKKFRRIPGYSCV